MGGILIMNLIGGILVIKVFLGGSLVICRIFIRIDIRLVREEMFGSEADFEFYCRVHD